jgi:predicted nucleotidyltransferase
MGAEAPGRTGGATPFDDLNRLLVELVAGAREVLGESFCGAYLQGSFAVGDADAHSDVDFVVVTEDEVTPEQQDDLRLEPRIGRRRRKSRSPESSAARVGRKSRSGPEGPDPRLIGQ